MIPADSAGHLDAIPFVAAIGGLLILGRELVDWIWPARRPRVAGRNQAHRIKKTHWPAQPQCVQMMSRAKEPCARRAGHRGGCRTRAALDNENAAHRRRIEHVAYGWQRYA